MFKGRCFLLLFSFSVGCASLKKSTVVGYYNERHRPQIHFSPPQKWMNDPNGMVYYNGTYHLFYQFNPNNTVWGPMHWGHATSTNLVHWQHQETALFPDSLGWIFSGSAVADVNNTSGFGKEGKTPLVAIFTHHSTSKKQAGRDDHQYQGLAYSLDNGNSWEKYAGNPVLPNPSIKDFRDPKVIWHDETGRWVMALATLDRITFYSSPDLKEWKKESAFGEGVGSHGGVWECPDLIAFNHKGQKIWVLLVSTIACGPNTGSATQYFTGSFDGKSFTPFDTATRWIDYGPDSYAGVTWSNTGDRKVFMAWMNNWKYANKVPTEKWRGAMTLPRELSLMQRGENFIVASQPVKELSLLQKNKKREKDVVLLDSSAYTVADGVQGPLQLRLSADKLEAFQITFRNNAGEELLAGYDVEKQSYFIDRKNAGIDSFANGFAARLYAPRLKDEKETDLLLVLDHSSLELFADKGTSVLTALVFPTAPYTLITIQSANRFRMKELSVIELKGIWQK